MQLFAIFDFLFTFLKIVAQPRKADIFSALSILSNSASAVY